MYYGRAVLWAALFVWGRVRHSPASGNAGDKMRQVILGVLMAVLLAACATPAEAPAPAVAAPSVTRTHEFAMTAKRTGLKYIVLVSEPLEALPAGKALPAIYVTDGNWYFGMATDSVRAQFIGGSMEQSFVVAIAYPDPKFESLVARRERDLVHKAFMGPTGMMGGGGEDFLAFLKEEVQPFVEQRFPIDKARTVLAGQSLGGLFATNVLLNKPDSFGGYLIGSPSMWADPSLVGAARNFTEGAGRRVYIGVGGGESAAMRSGAKNLAEALSAQSTGLSVESAELAKHSHMTMQGAWFATGLFYLLPKTPAE